MQPPDHDRESLPDDISREEEGPVPTHFKPDTGRRLKKGAAIAVAVLLLGFIVIRVARFFDERAVANASETAYAAPPPVDVVIAQPVRSGQDLVLPGQTAAWYESTIYARVNGYVANWLVDIGDHVKKGQLLATIETPELDAELAAARSALKASQAQVSAREAEGEFARSTNERWRDAPKGVVSDQERESKKADFNSASARFCRASAGRRGQIPRRAIRCARRVQAGESPLRRNHHRAQDRRRQSRHRRQRVDHDALVPHHPERSAAGVLEVPQSAAADLMKDGVPARSALRVPRLASSPARSRAPRRRSTRKLAPCAWRSICRTRRTRSFPACM